MKENKTLELCPECAEAISAAMLLTECSETTRIKCANCHKQRWGKAYTVKGVRHG